MTWHIFVLLLLQLLPLQAEVGHDRQHDPSAVFWRSLREKYITVVKDALTGTLLETPSVSWEVLGKGHGTLPETPYVAASRAAGLDWPKYGYTMVGTARLDMLQSALIDVISRRIPGDFIECGVWRGGASIFARLVWNAYHKTARTVYVADSFAGLPPSRTSLEQSIKWDHTPFLEVPLASVKRNFEHFGADALRNVVFIKGFFNDTLPLWRPRIKALSVLRLDGDMYESRADIMANLYEQVSVGGYVIVDDWFGFPCRNAVEDFMRHHGRNLDVVPIDKVSAYFVKEKALAVDGTWYRDFLRSLIRQ